MQIFDSSFDKSLGSDIVILIGENVTARSFGPQLISSISGRNCVTFYRPWKDPTVNGGYYTNYI